MPELPDLHVFAGNLTKRVCGRPIASATVFNPRRVSALSSALEGLLVGQTIEAIEREGKELRFSFSNGQAFCVHLMLLGRFELVPREKLHAVNSKILALGFEGGEHLTISDRMGQAKVTLNPEPSKVPDALSEAFTLDYLTRIARKKAALCLKEFLIDQHIVRGIGNAYADEILWKANLSPKSLAGKLPPDALADLYAAIPWILLDAIEQIKRLKPDIISGEERSFLRVHKPKTFYTQEGQPILNEEIAKKSTYYTSSQRLFV
ncbi:MAG TPA: DNA-formamidopyrimidine glycosylase family protein [Clostridia bacterium]|nr:DNA-formamidopyrimidine glycosylase family protein [Clostridia bacterium]